MNWDAVRKWTQWACVLGALAVSPYIGVRVSQASTDTRLLAVEKAVNENAGQTALLRDALAAKTNSQDVAIAALKAEQDGQRQRMDGLERAVEAVTATVQTIAKVVDRLDDRLGTMRQSIDRLTDVLMHREEKRP